MTSDGNPKSSATVGGMTLHSLLVPLPIVGLIGALVTDVMWLTTYQQGWATAASWLLGAGLLSGLAAGAAGLADYRGDRRIRTIRKATAHLAINLLVLAIVAINLVARLTGDAATIRDLGVWLSLAAVVLLIASGWLGGELVYRHGVGVAHDNQSGRGDGKWSRDRR